jgi:hypothetical protein
MERLWRRTCFIGRGAATPAFGEASPILICLFWIDEVRWLVKYHFIYVRGLIYLALMLRIETKVRDL